jgi:hypothetical protein
MNDEQKKIIFKHVMKSYRDGANTAIDSFGYALEKISYTEMRKEFYLGELLEMVEKAKIVNSETYMKSLQMNDLDV